MVARATRVTSFTLTDFRHDSKTVETYGTHARDSAQMPVFIGFFASPTGTTTSGRILPVRNPARA